MASSIETTSTTTTLKNNGNTYMSVDTNDDVTVTNDLAVNGTLNTTGVLVHNDAGAAVDFRVEGDTQPFLLFASGTEDKVGIKTSGPVEALQVSGAIKVTGAIETDTANSGCMGYQSSKYRFISWGGDNSTKGAYSFEGYSANGSANATYLAIDATGTIQIGEATTNASARTLSLKVASGGATGVAAQIASDSGTSYPWSNYNTSGTYVGGITCTSSATAFATSSDVRLKKDIKDAPSAVEKIKAARVVSHEWKAEDTAPVEFGFVAQELIKVVPQAVIEGKDKEDGGIEIPWGIDYSKLVPLLVKTIQELEARLAKLEENK